ncbi:MAG: glutaminase A [Planctomycetota bacterium]
MTDNDSTASPILRVLEGLLARHRDCRDGAVASYIPELAKVDPELFGICVATTDGHVYEVGESRHRFTIQSISKPFVYGLALDDHGPQAMARKVGVEPSGDAFNAISLHPEDGRPFNPMINAGAIATTGQIVAPDPEHRIGRILECFGRYVGHPLEIDAAVYESEARTGHRNRAIGHLLRNHEVLGDDPTPIVDVYFRQCSVLVDCRDLALKAATLANQGVNPLTGNRAIRRENVESVLSVMASCGMYDSSGGWIYNVGMPAKSGVGGGVVAVLPGQFGIGVFSPRLDRQGNSARAVKVCVDLSRAWELHQFNPPYCTQTSLRHSYTAAEKQSYRARPPGEGALLRDHGQAIRVVEVQGMLSLATTEPIVRDVLASCQGLRSIVIDFQHATGMTTSAATVFADLVGQLRAAGVRVFVSHEHAVPEMTRQFVERLGETTAGEVLRFPTLDAGLEACEDELVAAVQPDGELRVQGVRENELATGMAEDEVEVFESLLTVRRFGRGEEIVRQGDEAQTLFLITRGVVGVWAGSDARAARRVASFSAGTTVGGIAFIDGRQRSATLVADGEVECAVLERADFDRLQGTHPRIHARILINIAISIAAKLRLANDHLAVLSARRG